MSGIYLFIITSSYDLNTVLQFKTNSAILSASGLILRTSPFLIASDFTPTVKNIVIAEERLKSYFSLNLVDENIQ